MRDFEVSLTSQHCRNISKTCRLPHYVLRVLSDFSPTSIWLWKLQKSLQLSFWKEGAHRPVKESRLPQKLLSFTACWSGVPSFLSPNG